MLHSIKPTPYICMLMCLEWGILHASISTQLFISEQKKNKSRAPWAFNLSLPASKRPAGSTSWIKILPLTEHSAVYLRERSCLGDDESPIWVTSRRTSQVAINHVNVSCITQEVVCHIWSLVIYPNHHRISAPNLSANALFKFGSLEKSFQATVKST